MQGATCMKPRTLIFAWAALFLGSGASLSHAAVLTQTINFDPPRAIVDQTSGNNADFTYEHLLSGWSSANFTALSGKLELTHTGNSNTGPTQEIWSIFSGPTLIGTLGSSEGLKKTDSWQLPETVLAALTSGNPWRLSLFLSERTSFNSERLDLIRSELSVEYQAKNKLPAAPTPSVPEPHSALLLGAGMIAACFTSGVFRRVSKAKETY